MDKIRSGLAACLAVAGWLMVSTAYGVPDSLGSVALGTVFGGGSSSQPAAETPRLSPEQLGGLLGGVATRVDQCVKGGLLADDGTRAETQLDRLLTSAERATGETNVFSQIRGGWEKVRLQMAATEQTPLTTRDCSVAARQWRQAKSTYPIQ
ncbi:hypothetical protein PTE30175_01947 [Pandoraea terrae]|uniref:Uncharacterized protein n=1 Tax=Pandoraea terrae TaxID=1537710 RepID=A0A5E4UFI9_9BURK|nr:hypothetical protein [Pandoraea terrae]VVD98747.1 hypothetical protein PTE30175_01947 [Pandoraea terrae]